MYIETIWKVKVAQWSKALGLSFISLEGALVQIDNIPMFWRMLCLFKKIALLIENVSVASFHYRKWAFKKLYIFIKR